MREKSHDEVMAKYYCNRPEAAGRCSVLYYFMVGSLVNGESSGAIFGWRFEESNFAFELVASVRETVFSRVFGVSAMR